MTLLSQEQKALLSLVNTGVVPASLLFVVVQTLARKIYLRQLNMGIFVLLTSSALFVPELDEFN